MPDFGAPGVCLDYDEDCFDMDQPLRVKCWLLGADFTGSERNKSFGGSQGEACPFMD
jgi:hypothetical protein